MARSRVDYQDVDADYLEHRSLKKGAAGWILLAGLGVSYVISGDFAGWNFGLDEGGWGGLLIATILMGLMYTCMVFGLAEMSSALPVAGAGYGFARRALGPIGGFATGMAVLIEYAVAPAAIAVFIGGYVEALGLFGLTNGWLVYLIAYVVFIGVHLYGVGEALKLMFGITAIAVVALIAAVIGLAPKFSTDNLFDIAPNGSTLSSDFLPYGISGVVAALVYGIWFFLAVEGVPLAAEETEDPEAGHAPRHHHRDAGAARVRRLMLLVVPGAAGSEAGAHVRQPAPGGDPSGLRQQLAAGGLRQLRRAGRAGRELLLDHLRLLPPAVRPVPRRLPAQGAVADQRPEHPVGGADRARDDRLRAGRDHQGRRPADQHRRLRGDDLLRAAQPQPHHAAPSRARPRARLPHARRRRHHRASAWCSAWSRSSRRSSSTSRRPGSPRPSSPRHWRTSGSTAGTTSSRARPRRSSRRSARRSPS